MTVEVLYFTGCPNAASTLELVRRCLARLALQIDVVEHDGNHASPTVRVNGIDVMGAPSTWELSCRLDIPTEEKVSAALRRAMGAEM